MKNKGYIHIYTGNGKGKTTAALGLALRAAGWGKRTYIAQFMKKTQYGELISIEKYLKDFITIEQFGVPGFHHTSDNVSEEEKNAAILGIEGVKKAIASENTISLSWMKPISWPISKLSTPGTCWISWITSRKTWS